MSQENIDNLMAYLKEHPDEKETVQSMLLHEIVEFAGKKGFTISAEELQARQALIHLINGT